jgi:phosphatidylinositol alpha-1,6-mannosyltransferase
MASATGRPAGNKVLLLTNNLPPVRGGSAIVYDNLARHAAERIIVVAPRRNYQDGLPFIAWREHDRGAPYRVIRRDLLRTVMREDGASGVARLFFLTADIAIRARLLATIIRCILRREIAAVCVGELMASAWVLTAMRLFPHIARAVYVHGEEITTQDAYDPGLVRRRNALLQAHHIVVVSRFTAAAVEDLLGESGRGRIRLIENGVDTTRFRPIPRQAGLAALYGLQDCFVFLSVCRLLEKKGVDNAIRAFAQVVAEYPDSRFLVVGDGPFRADLERIAEGCFVADKVVFCGAVADDELIDHYALGDAFVMPNRRLPNGDTEGFGLVFLEANACGLPVIAGTDGGSTDAVQDGANGLVVDGHSVPSIAEAMLALRGDAALRERLRAGGFRAAAASDWQHKAQAFLDMFDVTARDEPFLKRPFPRWLAPKGPFPSGRVPEGQVPGGPVPGGPVPKGPVNSREPAPADEVNIV